MKRTLSAFGFYFFGGHLKVLVPSKIEPPFTCQKYVSVVKLIMDGGDSVVGYRKYRLKVSIV